VTTEGGVLPVAASVVATGDVQLTVFGVDALSPYGIGALFILPGLVAVLVFLLLAHLYPRTKGLPDTIGLTDLSAMPIVVPAAALVYVVIWFFSGENWTRELSTASVAFLFGSGMLLGFLAWLVLVVVWTILVDRKRFVIGDDARRVLKKLRARGGKLHLPEFRLNNVRYFYLVPGEDDTVLATPAIEYTFRDGTPDAKRTSFLVASSRDKIDEVLAASRDGTVELRTAAPGRVQALKGVVVDDKDDVLLLRDAHA
jgi:hypothetical protein